MPLSQPKIAAIKSRRTVRKCVGLVGCLTLMLNFSCASPENFVYPTEVAQEINYICARIYDPQFSWLLESNRLVPVSKIINTEGHIVAIFKNGRKVVVPLASSLPQDEEFGCGVSFKHYPCQKGFNQDSKCTRTGPANASDREAEKYRQ